MSLKNWLTYVRLRLFNFYFKDTPKTGAQMKGVWRYKTKLGDWEPMGGQGGIRCMLENL